jgi:putative sugar O-methyltransferase
MYKKFLQKIYPKKFHKHWNILRKNKNPNLDQDLKFLTESFIRSKSYKFVSNFWHLLNIAAYDELSKNGLSKFGSTIAGSYFTFKVFEEEYIKESIDKIKNKNINLSADIFKIHNNFSYKESLNYNLICLILFYNIADKDIYKYLKNLQDKTYLGYDTPYISLNNLKITTDKLVSLLDFDKIDRAFNLNNIKSILEIGAGSGRTSEAILSIKNNISYVICDIPPAIYISFKRLKLAYPDKAIEYLVDIQNKDELNKKIKKNNISFIYPHQMELISKDAFDLTIAIDCFHEMDKKTIAHYFKNINNFSKNFYFSIWGNSKGNYTKTLFKKTERLNYYKGDYNIPKNWKINFEENLVFPANQLSLGFKIKN